MAGGGSPSVGPASDGELGPRSVQGTRWPPVGRGALGTARRQTRLGRTPTMPVCQAHGGPGVLPWGLTPAGRWPLTGPAGPGHSLGAAPVPPPRASRVRLPLQDPPTPCVCLWLAVRPQHVRTPVCSLPAPRALRCARCCRETITRWACGDALRRAAPQRPSPRGEPPEQADAASGQLGPDQCRSALPAMSKSRVTGRPSPPARGDSARDS